MPALPYRTKQARSSYPQHLQYLISRSVTAVDDGTEIDIGTVPAGSTLVRALCGFQVNVAFDGTTLIDMGFRATSAAAADPNFYLTSGVTTAIAFVPFDEAVTQAVAVETRMTGTLTGGTVTVGEGRFILAYIVNDL